MRRTSSVQYIRLGDGLCTLRHPAEYNVAVHIRRLTMPMFPFGPRPYPGHTPGVPRPYPAPVPGGYRPPAPAPPDLSGRDLLQHASFSPELSFLLAMTLKGRFEQNRRARSSARHRALRVRTGQGSYPQPAQRAGGGGRTAPACAACKPAAHGRAALRLLEALAPSRRCSK